MEGRKQSPNPERLELLNTLAMAIKMGLQKEGQLHLRFVCTHNARRSQLSQIICYALAKAYHLNISTSSAGTHKTQVHPMVVKALNHLGFRTEKVLAPPAEYLIYFAEDQEPIPVFSKTLKEASGNGQSFWTVMVCEQADAQCPFVPGASHRSVLSYADPGEKDGTDQALEAYLSTARSIITEWQWMLQKIIAP